MSIVEEFRKYQEHMDLSCCSKCILDKQKCIFRMTSEAFWPYRNMSQYKIIYNQLWDNTLEHPCMMFHFHSDILKKHEINLERDLKGIQLKE